MRTRSIGSLAFTASMFACASAHGQCDAQWFTNVGKPGLDGIAWASCVWDDGAGSALYVGGDFLNGGNVGAKSIGKWDGKNWSAIPGNPMITTYALAPVSPSGNGPESYLCAGGEFVVGMGSSAAALYPNGWRALDSISSRILALQPFDSDGPGPLPTDLYAGTDAGSPVRRYRFNLGYFVEVPVGGPAINLAFASDSTGLYPVLFAGGYTAYTGPNIRQWDAFMGWRDLSTGTNGPVNALCIFDDGSGPALFAGGDFTDAGGIPVHSIAKWDGEAWSDVGGGIKGGLLAGVYSLAVFDDGNGEALFVGGNFDSAGGQPASNVARWDGVNWSALGEGVTGDGATVLTMTPFKTGNKEFLYVGGWFDHAGGMPTNNIARWGCPQEKVCYPDCDGTNSLDLFDFLCFVNQFNAGVPYSDCTQDGSYDLFDFLCFVNAFNAGCP